MEVPELVGFNLKEMAASKEIAFGALLWILGFVISSSGIIGGVRLTPAAIVLIIFESALNLSPVSMPFMQTTALGIIIVFGFLSGTVIAFSGLSEPLNVISYSVATGVISGFLAIAITAIQVFTTTPQYPIVLLSGLIIIPVLTIPVSVCSSIISIRICNMVS
jgi:hypothetical protein